MISVILYFFLLDNIASSFLDYNDYGRSNKLVDYKGFDKCNIDSWSCQWNKDNLEVTYECPSHDPTGRVWAWTARLPEKTTVFNVKNCQHLEVHMDCTGGSRNFRLKKFTVSNVDYLNILPPSRPGYTLHDNVFSALLPQEFQVENVRHMNLIPELFTVPYSECKYVPTSPPNFNLVNVTLTNLPTKIIDGFTFDKFTLKNIIADNLNDSTFSLTATEIVITNSTFSELGTKAFQLVAKESVLISKNNFTKLRTNSLVVRSKLFEFSDNNVQEIMTQGLDVLASKIAFTRNNLMHIDTRALENIAMAYVVPTYELAFKFQYNFTKNVIWSLEPGSLHPNYVLFKDTCSTIRIEDNQFDCSCNNLGWVTISHAIGPKVLKFRDFYEDKIVKGNQACIQNTTCSFSAIINRMNDICSNKTDIRKICTQPVLIQNENETDSSQKHQPQQQQQQQQQQLPTIINSNTPSQKIQISREPAYPPIQENDFQDIDKKPLAMAPTPAPYYTENHALNQEKQEHNIWYTIIPVFTILIITALALALWWYKRFDRRHHVTTVYKNHVENEDDNPIVINEHNNQLYHERN